MDQRTQDAYDAVAASAFGFDVPAQSQRNLRDLQELQPPLTQDELHFYRRFWNLPLILEHRSQSWDKITGSNRMLSLFELAKVLALAGGRTTATARNIPIAALRVPDVRFADLLDMLGDVTINTSERDLANFGNVDFVFFKLNVVGTHVNDQPGYAGVARGSPRFFDADQLFDNGWITLDDWVSYSAGGTFTNDLQPAWYGFVPQGLTVQYDRHGRTKDYLYKSYAQIGPAFSQYSKPVSNIGRGWMQHMRQEAFFGPDIRSGLALTIIHHLRLANPGASSSAARSRRITTARWRWSWAISGG
jgi:hypothetical protein